MRGAEMRGAELRLPTRTASARRVPPLLRERERPVRSTAVPGGLRARVPCHAAAQRAALGLRSPRARAPCSRPLRGRRRAERPAPAPPARRGVAAACVCSSAHPQLGMLRGCEMLSAPCARGPRGLCSAGVSAGAGGWGPGAGPRRGVAPLAPSHTCPSGRVERRSLRQSWRGPQALRLLPQPSRATGSALRCHFRDPWGSPVGRGSASLARPSLARRAAPL